MVAMFLGAFGAGYVPLAFNLSESRLRAITIFGAGLLVGTALAVIIPEGIAMHYASQLREAHGRHLLADAHAHGEEEITHTHPGHWQIGASLAFGFAFQLIVGAHATSRAHEVAAIEGARNSHFFSPPRPTPLCIMSPSDRLSGGLHSHSHGVALPTDAEGGLQAGDDSAKSKSALVGMIVHAAVDGVALGATVKEGDGALGLLVFVAIMLHKAPSAFGLATYLLHHGITPEGVKRRLLLFSASAPLGAFATYMGLSLAVVTYKQELLSILLLFSGGTFLYVATAHVLPEIQAGVAHPHEDERHENCAEGSHGAVRQRTPPKMKWRETALLVSGVLLPLLLDVHHGH